ncbi:MAG: DUF559 domain-containing protein [Syntrophothermus sp.]
MERSDGHGLAKCTGNRKCGPGSDKGAVETSPFQGEGSEGPSHCESVVKEHAKLRTEYLEELGYKVVRFTNDEVKFNVQGVSGEVLQVTESRITEIKSRN